jgi:predicted dehydrogenase
MHRRFFLSTALAAASARAVAKLRIGFLGGSHVHAVGKARVLLENPGYELAGVCEESPAARTAYARLGVRLLSREQLLNDASIPVIAVESEVKDHARDARQALEAGKHVHVEKPPAATLDEFRALAALAARKRLRMQMGYMWRYNPAVNAALDAARQGRLGDIFMVRGVINTSIPAGERRGLALFPGGEMFELGSHLIDAITRLMGRPEKVTPFLRKHGKFDDNLNDNTVAVLEYPKALAIVSTATLQPHANPHRMLEIMGTSGAAIVHPIEPPALEIDVGSKPETVPMPSYRRYVDDFVELAAAIREGKPLAVTPQEDLLVEETLLRAAGM